MKILGEIDSFMTQKNSGNRTSLPRIQLHVSGSTIGFYHLFADSNLRK